MRVSAGFAVTGLSGKIRIQILPPRLTWCVIARRAASICREVIQVASSAISPKSPKATELPRWAMPLVRPRCCLRYLTRLGINIVVAPSNRVLARRRRHGRHGRHGRRAHRPAPPPRPPRARPAPPAALPAAPATPAPAAAALAWARLLLGLLGPWRGRLHPLELTHRVGEYFTFVDPALHADTAIGRVRVNL